jgi:hypothetical protein
MARERVDGVSYFTWGDTAGCQIVRTDVYNDMVWREVDYPMQFFPNMFNQTPALPIENDFESR